MFFLSENLFVNIVCSNVHAKFLFQIFLHFEICFLIMGSFAPVSRNGYPSVIYMTLFYVIPYYD
jgi:predicted membrane channel-forming protein YqfA (hemolysin III family)